ncbi:nucleotide disphospho-sugar-binding domain-containing protein [Bifidobacterium indicum]|uniref:nucleotide disphospho-sugar-binding domain-containing protein n=1 Tax=Bifidobacterium indicum TaxID=1691 RepID=UPI0030D96F7D
MINWLFLIEPISLSPMEVCSADEALYYQVPMVVVPMADDRPAVGARIAELGLGTVLDRKAIDGTSLRQTASDVLGDQSIATNVKQFGEDMRNSGGNRRVMEDLNNLLRDKRKHAR